MLAQLFFTPSGMILDAAWTAVAAGDATAPVVEAPQLSSAGLAASQAGASSVVTGAVSHAFESTVGIETSAFSLREPFVCAADAPRPLLPPLPRSVPRPRPPLPLSKPARPPRETLDWFVESPKDVTVVSFTLDLDRSFFAFETSPHCVIVPAGKSIQYSVAEASTIYI
jgi:hypothetical protein